MNKLIIVTLLMLSITLAGCSDKKATTAINSSPQVIANQPPANILSDTQDGVTVEVENIEKQAGKTIVKLAMDNHRYDLASFDAITKTNLAGVKPDNYQVISSAMGGHHVQAELSFPGELAGQLALGLGDSLTFNFYVE